MFKPEIKGPNKIIMKRLKQKPDEVMVKHTYLNTYRQINIAITSHLETL